jgi:hypothetical protein
MSKRAFMPRTEADKELWLKNFANKLNTYASKYNIATGEVTDMQAAATAYSYWVNYGNQYNEYVKKLTHYRNELRDGVSIGATASVVPTPPAVGTAPAAVEPGIFRRVASIAGVIKSRNNYTLADGNDLGIEGAEIPPPDLIGCKPSIGIRLIEGGKPEILWKKGDYEGINIEVDRGNGTFTFLAVDSYPNYTDNAPLPAAGSSAIWKYRAIYRYNDIAVGLWSDIVSVTVG